MVRLHQVSYSFKAHQETGRGVVGQPARGHRRLRADHLPRARVAGRRRRAAARLPPHRHQRARPAVPAVRRRRADGRDLPRATRCCPGTRWRSASRRTTARVFYGITADRDAAARRRRARPVPPRGARRAGRLGDRRRARALRAAAASARHEGRPVTRRLRPADRRPAAPAGRRARPARTAARARGHRGAAAGVARRTTTRSAEYAALMAAADASPAARARRPRAPPGRRGRRGRGRPARAPGCGSRRPRLDAARGRARRRSRARHRRDADPDEADLAWFATQEIDALL